MNEHAISIQLGRDLNQMDCIVCGMDKSEIGQSEVMLNMKNNRSLINVLCRFVPTSEIFYLFLYVYF